jgi:hypothetical protein
MGVAGASENKCMAGRFHKLPVLLRLNLKDLSSYLNYRLINAPKQHENLTLAGLTAKPFKLQFRSWVGTLVSQQLVLPKH